MAVAIPVEEVGSKVCLHHSQFSHVKYTRIAGEKKEEKEKFVQEESSSEDPK
jgi:hypothetical protein